MSSKNVRARPTLLDFNDGGRDQRVRKTKHVLEKALSLKRGEDSPDFEELRGLRVETRLSMGKEGVHAIVRL